MNYEFKDAATLNVSQTLLIGLAGPTGAGKTESAMRIAKGIAGEGQYAVIDTENKRALNKKSRYAFKHLDLQPPYTPENYQGAIQAAIKAGYRAVIVDSFSHEWDGEGGLQDDANTALERMSGGDAAKAERLTALAWKQPKQRHKKLMAYLRKCDVPIIFCLRAEPKIKFQKDANGKTQVIDAGWLPIAEKLFGFDMLIYALMMAENPGIPVHLKKLEPEFEPMFPVGKQLTEESGRQLAAWAKGQAAAQEPRKGVSAEETREAASRIGGYKGEPELVSEAQIEAIHVALSESNVALDAFLAKAEIKDVRLLASSDCNKAVKWIRSQKKAAA